MMEFKRCLLQQLQMHPSMQSRDVVKLCYQAACGAEHLLSDTAGARAYFEEEYASVPNKDEPLYEQISSHICRVNLGAWKRSGMPKEWLFSMFAATRFSGGGREQLPLYLKAAEEVLQENGFNMDAWRTYLAEYRRAGMPVVRHSEIYRKSEQPAYRIVAAAYMKQLLDLNL